MMSCACRRPSVVPSSSMIASAIIRPPLRSRLARIRFGSSLSPLTTAWSRPNMSPVAIAARARPCPSSARWCGRPSCSVCMASSARGLLDAIAIQLLESCRRADDVLCGGPPVHPAAVGLASDLAGSGKADVHLLEPRLTDCDENSHGFWKGSARGLDALRLTRSGECVSLRARY